MKLETHAARLALSTFNDNGCSRGIFRSALNAETGELVRIFASIIRNRS